MYRSKGRINGSLEQVFIFFSKLPYILYVCSCNYSTFAILLMHLTIKQ